MHRRLLIVVTAIAAALWMPSAHAKAQSVGEHLDKPTFLRGVAELYLPRVLEAYISDHPAQDVVTLAQYDIARALLDYYQPGASTRQRTDAIERVIELRQELIDSHPGHPERVVWLCEQATDLLFNLLPLDAADAAVLIGLPSPAQRARFTLVAERVNTLMEDAEIEIAPALRQMRELEDETGSAALQNRRRTLAMNERDRRIPFLRGVGAFMTAEIDNDRTRYNLAAELLLTVAPRLEGALAARARLYAAMALLRLNDADEADELLQLVLSDQSLLPTDRLLAQIANVDVAVARDGAEAGLELLDSIAAQHGTGSNLDLFFTVLVADHRFLLLQRTADQAASDTQRVQRLRSAFDSYLSLLREDGRESHESLRNIVMNKLALAVNDEMPLAELPPLVTLGRARRLAEAGQRDAADDLLRTLLDRPQLAAEDHARTLYELGSLSLQRGEPLEATDHYFQVARRFPQQPDAPQAIVHVARIMMQMHEQLPDEQQVLERLREVLKYALQAYPDQAAADHWRFATGSLALKEQRYDDAIASFESVRAGSPLKLDARVMEVVTQRTAAQQVDANAEEVQRNRDVIDRIEQLLPALEQAQLSTSEAAKQESLRSHATILRVMQAESLLALQEYAAALSVLETLPSPATLDHEAAAQVLRARIRVFQESGEIERAHEAIAQFIEAVPEQATQVVPPILAALEKGVKAVIDEGRPVVAQQKARRELLPIAEMMEGHLQKHPAGADQAVGLKARIADAYRYSEEYARALALYESLLAEHPSALQILFGKAECLYGLGQTRFGDAFAIYKRIVAVGAAHAGEYYWQAQLRTLQILDALQRNTEDIYPHIQRLRQQDPELGGPNFRREFQQLQNKYS